MVSGLQIVHYTPKKSTLDEFLEPAFLANTKLSHGHLIKDPFLQCARLPQHH